MSESNLVIKPMISPMISNEQIMPGANLLWLEAPDIASTAKPGQFVMVRSGPDTVLRRPFSLHRVDREQGRIALLFTVVGKGTEWLAKEQAGGTLDILGPLGNGFTLPEQKGKVELIGGGIGAAPMAFLAEEAVEQGQEVIIFLGARNEDSLLPDKYFPAGVNINHVTEDGSGEYDGMLLVGWAKMHLKFRAFQNITNIYACGPMGMYRSMATMPELRQKHVQVSLEMRMACGIGVCYGCTVPTANGLMRVCKEGPIFELVNILWDDPIIAQC